MELNIKFDEKMLVETANRALDEFKYNGKTIREWADLSLAEARGERLSMPTCPSCIYAQGICEKTGVKIRYSTGCSYHKPKPITNADRIRGMTDDELDGFLNEVQGDAYLVGFHARSESRFTPYGKRWLDWLKQEGE